MTLCFYFVSIFCFKQNLWLNTSLESTIMIVTVTLSLLFYSLNVKYLNLIFNLNKIFCYTCGIFYLKLFLKSKSNNITSSHIPFFKYKLACQLSMWNLHVKYTRNMYSRDRCGQWVSDTILILKPFAAYWWWLILLSNFSNGSSVFVDQILSNKILWKFIFHLKEKSNKDYFRKFAFAEEYHSPLKRWVAVA